MPFHTSPFGAGALGIAGGFADFFLNRSEADRTNERNLALSREGIGFLGGGRDAAFANIANSRATLENELGQGRLESLFSSGSTDFGRLSFDAKNILDVGGRNARGVLGQAGGELRALGRQAQGALGAQLRDPGELASQAMSFLGDERFEESQKSFLNQIGASSEARGALTRQEAAGRALGGGQSLETAGASLAALGREEGRTRSLQAVEARGQQERLTSEREVERARLGQGALLQQASLNTALAQAQAQTSLGQAELGGKIRGAQADVFTGTAAGRARFGAELGIAGANAQNIDENQLFQGLLSRLQATGQLDSFLAQANLGFGQGAAGLLTGTPLLTQLPGPIFQTGLNTMQTQQQINNLAPKGGGAGGSLTIAGFGGGLQTGGCVAGTARITTKRGVVKLRDVRSDDWVLGIDDSFHHVIGKDFGAVAPECRVPMISVATQWFVVKLTTDHPLPDGRAAAELRVDDRIATEVGVATVSQITPVPYEAVGDLLLEGVKGYYANGIAVLSTLDREKWTEHLRCVGCRQDGNVLRADRNAQVFVVLPAAGPDAEASPPQASRLQEVET